LLLFYASLNTELPIRIYAAGNDDSNDKEIGVKWINDYSGTAVVVLRGREK